MPDTLRAMKPARVAVAATAITLMLVVVGLLSFLVKYSSGLPTGIPFR